MAAASISAPLEASSLTPTDVENSPIEVKHLKKIAVTEDVNNNNAPDEGENSIVELESMLQQFPEQDKQLKIRNALRELRRELQKEDKTEIKKENSFLNNSDSSNLPEAEGPPSPEVLTPAQDSTKTSPITSTFSIKFKVPNNLTRAESVKESRVTPSPNTNVERAGSWKLSRPKDFLSSSSPIEESPKAAPLFLTKARRSESPQNVYNKVAAPFGKSLNRRASSPVIITSTPLHHTITKTPSPLAQADITVKRSNSSKENDFSATPIPVCNVRRSRSILGRVLGLKLHSGNTPLSSSISAVPEVTEKSKKQESPLNDNSFTPIPQSEAGASPPLRINSFKPSPNSSAKSDSDSSESLSDPERNSYDVQQVKVVCSESDSESSYSGNEVKVFSHTSEENSPDSEYTPDKMDRFSKRSLQNRVSVKAQILAAEDGNKTPTKNTHSTRRTKPLFSGDNLSARLNKYSTNTENTTNKTANTHVQTARSPTVKVNSSKFEQNNNIINSKQTNGNIEKAMNNTLPKSPSKSEDKLNNKNTYTRTSRKTRESSTKKTDGEAKLEKVANITTEELKSYSNIKKSEEPPKEVTPGSLNDVEDSLSSWSERRKKKRRPRDVNDNITKTPPSTPVDESSKTVSMVETKELTKTESVKTTEIVVDVGKPDDIKTKVKSYTLDLKQQTTSNSLSGSPASPISPVSSDSGSTRSRRRRGRITSSKSTTSEQSSLPGTPLADKPETKVLSKPSTPKVEQKKIEEALVERTSTSSSPVSEEVKVAITFEFEATNDARKSPSVDECSPTPIEEQHEKLAEDESNIQTQSLQDDSISESDVAADKSSTSASDPIEEIQSDEKEPIEIVKDNKRSDTVNEKIFDDSSDLIDGATENTTDEKEAKTKAKDYISKEVTTPDLNEVVEDPKKDIAVPKAEVEEDKPIAKPRRRRIRSNVEDTPASSGTKESKTKNKKKLSSSKVEDKPIPTVEVEAAPPTEKTDDLSPVDTKEENKDIATEEPKTEKEESPKNFEEKKKTMHFTLDNMHECKDETILQKLLDTCTEFEDRRLVRRALRELRRAENDVAISDKLSMLKSSKTHASKMNGKSRDDISLTSSKFTRTMKLDGDRGATVKTLMETRTTEISKSNSLTTNRVETKQRSSMSTRETKKIGSIFDREDDEDAKPKGGSKYELERRKLERRHDIQRIRSLPATSSKDARKAFVAKLESQSPKPSGNKKIGRSPTFVVPNAKNVKQMLLKWLQAKTRGYNHVDVTNFSSSWATGMAFCALVHHFFPEAFDYDSLDPKNRADNFNLAFNTAEQKGDIPILLDTEDMVSMDVPDWKCVYTYIQEFYKRIRELDLV